MQAYLSAWKDGQSNFITVEVLWRYCEEHASQFKCGDGLRMQYRSGGPVNHPDRSTVLDKPSELEGEQAKLQYS